MPKIPVGEYGYYARVSDPEGNIIGIWEERSK
jgi:predicted enzyme related to lactoylglutathione lyase